MSELRYLPNNLKPITTDNKSLNNTLITLKAAIASSVELLLQHITNSKDRTSSRDSLYTGDSGIALTFLRLAVQFDAADLGDYVGKDVRVQIPKYINKTLPILKAYQVKPGHLSPLDSPVGPALVQVLASLENASSSGATTDVDDSNWSAAIETFENAITTAIEDQSLGGDEVLYGRAGLLWAMLNLQMWVTPNAPSQKERDIARIVNTRSIEQVVRRIIEAGKLGARWYTKTYGEEPLPLMWPWHDKFYLGAIHGVAGILTVLLQAPRDIIAPHMRLVSQCISALCKITCQHDGHLPSSLPARQRKNEYVQICHGSPGLVLLLAIFRIRFRSERKEDWETAEALACEKVWEEGLVRKGIGVCHGVSGNAWTLLLHGLSHTGNKETNSFLSRGLAFLIQAAEIPPLVPSEASPFRTPDHPLSLFEGLAGAVCAWIDACVIIREALGETVDTKKLLFGLPGLGGIGAHGFL